ncbi:hypothetical protein ABL78_5728 [Leptomonas seymouri]|uniref:Transmembrane protein n=1 Tax=Leptomonas seymouri TaxID=5684 RepID=A0A0N1PBF2_LEPSE|nr:hypothetical protein ABL78_5728 [Leptomonas seymouri]|eukprot:KPI85220.1 hypothetical protein ABL78_5728 [Leptomonas seymouri]
MQPQRVTCPRSTSSSCSSSSSPDALHPARHQRRRRQPHMDADADVPCTTAHNARRRNLAGRASCDSDDAGDHDKARPGRSPAHGLTAAAAVVAGDDAEYADQGRAFDDEEDIIDELDLYYQASNLYLALALAAPPDGPPRATTDVATLARGNASAAAKSSSESAASPTFASPEQRKAETPVARAHSADAAQQQRQREAKSRCNSDADHDAAHSPGVEAPKTSSLGRSDRREERASYPATSHDSSSSGSGEGLREAFQVVGGSHIKTLDAGSIHARQLPRPHETPHAAHRPTSSNSNSNGGDRWKLEADAVAADPSDGPHMPPLMPELDGELLQVIKNYYRLKHAAAAASAATCTTDPHVTQIEYARSGIDAAGHHRAAAERNGVQQPAAAAGWQRPSVQPWQQQQLPAFFAPEYTGPALDRMGNARNGRHHEAFARSPPLQRQLPSLPAHPHTDPRFLGTLSSPPAYAATTTRNTAIGSSGAASDPTALSHPQLSALVGDVDGAVLPPSVLSPFAAPTAATPGGLRHRSSGVSNSQSNTNDHNTAVERASDPGGRLPYSTAAASDRDQSGNGGRGGGAGGGSAFGSGLASGLSALSSLPSYSSTSFVRAYVSDISLSLEPALIVSALTAALNIVVVVFLQNHVLDTRDHLGLFLIGSYMTFASYYMIYYFLERFSGSFRRIASQDKKFYIIGNLIKAGILISITPFACIHLVKIVVFDEWESNILRNLGCIYAIPDFISMVIVRRMRWSTWVHHACVVVFNYFSIMNNYQHENVCRCVVVYAAFSSFAYCVNVLLASRFLGVSANVARVLSFVALVVYALCCAVNWAWQAFYLRRLLTTGHDHWTVYVYMLLISLVMWDDIVLNRWLLHHARNNVYVAAQHLQQHRHRQQQHQQHPSPLLTAQLRPGLRFRHQEERQLPVSQAPAPPPVR